LTWKFPLKAPSIKNLRKKINRVTNPLPLIKELAERMIFSSPEELNTFQQLFMDFWNLSPRDEFQGKSPQEVDSQGLEEQIDLKGIKIKDVPLVKDLETLVNYFRENQVKVSLKNKWIPFKHLKLIEENFISSDKDSFNLFGFGKEESRGEESAKRYIYFIDLLSRAAKFIYIDKKGYIQVNVPHFQKFTRKSYGEKVFDLLLTWIENLEWKRLQRRDFEAIYAEDFQKMFTDILYLFHKYRVNEKIEVEEIVDQLYGPEIDKTESPVEVMGHLMIMIEIVLLTYLKWLGIIKAQKEILIPYLYRRL